MTKSGHKCTDCFDELEHAIESYTGCKCPACISLITTLFNDN